jgi:cardiolipin synthase
MGLTLLFLLVQIAAAITLTILIFYWWPWAAYVGIAVSILIFLHIVKKDEAGAYKQTWIIIVLLLPQVGGLMYMLFGKEHYTRRRLTGHALEHAVIAKLLDGDGALEYESTSGRVGALLRYVRGASGYHAFEKTASQYFPTGEEMFASMLCEIKSAKKYIFMEFFIVKRSEMWDELLAALTEKAQAGVEVRIIADDFGSQKLFTNSYIKYVRKLGIQVLRFNPLIPFIIAFMNNRDHRKMLVIDGRIAFTGGINISDEYINRTHPFGHWKDTGLKLTGDGAWPFALMFIEMWDTFTLGTERIVNHAHYRAESFEESDGLVLPFGCSPLNTDRLGENIYIDILNRAQRYVYIFTPYLIISEKMKHALTMAARRGVDVRIVMPGTPDKPVIFRLSKSYYRPLLLAGVRIFEYTPGFMHAKSFVCDDKLAVVGTINLDFRSLYLHFECATLLVESRSIADIKNDADSTIAVSREVRLGDVKRSSVREFYELFRDALLHIFAPLL